ncbi:hypothetical protein ZWY2020_027983 [Hordeum vulgare]|nr:hypothetical protein ZWY2020_027983 [Hordeum vulgare]
MPVPDRALRYRPVAATVLDLDLCSANLLNSGDPGQDLVELGVGDAAIAVDVVDVEGIAQLGVELVLPAAATVEGRELAEVHIAIMDATSRPPADSVAGGAMARDTAASSEGEILPSPSVSKRENTFLIGGLLGGGGGKSCEGSSLRRWDLGGGWVGLEEG